MTKTHDYGAVLNRMKRTKSWRGYFELGQPEAIVHALTVMQELPGVIEGMRCLETHGEDGPHLSDQEVGFNDALDAVLDKMKKTEVNDE
jgi:hypothetical protein